MALNMRVWASKKPAVEDFGRGFQITDNGDGSYQFTATTCPLFAFNTPKADITKIEVLEDDFTSLGVYADRSVPFADCVNMTDFICQPDSFKHVTDFDGAWENCTSLTSFPMMDSSSGTSFRRTWIGCTALTSFPSIDTSKGTNFYIAWKGCTSLTSFPTLDTSSGTNFDSAWRDCTALTSFPDLDTSKGTNFSNAWNGCTSLKCMQRVDTTSATKTTDMFLNAPLCRPDATERALIEQTPGINWVSDVPYGDDCCPKLRFDVKVTSPTEPGVTRIMGGTITVTDNGDGTWQLTSSDVITHFDMGTNKADITKVEIITEELIDLENTFNALSSMTEFVAKPTAFGAVSSFFNSWIYCSSLKSFPLIDTSSGTNFSSAWQNNTSLTSFPLLDTSSGTDFKSAWNTCSNLASFPLLDTSSGTDFGTTWNRCTFLSSFPKLNMSNGLIFRFTWYDCTSLTSFPSIDTSKGTHLDSAWCDCTSLKCMQRVDTTSAITVINMFAGAPLCRPNTTERAQIEQTPGINWVTNVPDGEDCCTWVPPMKACLGDKEITGCYLRDDAVDLAFYRDAKVCHMVPPLSKP